MVTAALAGEAGYVGMTSARAVRSVLGLPWDVTVRPVAAGSLGCAYDAERPPAGSYLGALGVALSGVTGVLLETVEVGGREVLRSIRPSAAPVTGEEVPLGALLDGLSDDGAVPVLIEGSSFVQAVLSALLEVRPGQRCTYAGLAVRADRPRAIRAAARVMATNRVPLVLPCHRVVPSAGGTGRYGWGDRVKAALLEHEARTADRQARFSD